jgi:hypothetical protein
MMWHGALRITSGRMGTLHPRRQWALSAALIAVFAALGLSALPHDLVASGSRILMRDTVASGPIGQPVFVLRDNGSAVRFGDAAAGPNGTIRVGVYDPLDPLLGHATEAVSLPGDPRLLWLLASTAEREQIRTAAVDLAHAVPHAALDILQSPEFTNEYRDQLVQRLHIDIEAAWRETQKSGAWQALLSGYEPVLRDATARELRPVIEARFHGVPMRMLRANALMLMDPFSPVKWDMTPVEDALQAALEEVQQRQLPERTVSRLLQTPATTDFLRGFMDALLTQMADDRALRNLVGEMVLDNRFRTYLNPVNERVMDLGRIGPRLLVSLHGSTDLNPVAGYIVRTLVSGQFDRVVVFMSPTQRDKLMTLDPDAVHPLVRVASG